MSKIELRVVDNPEPDPEVDKLLDYLSELMRQAGTIHFWATL